MNIERFYEENYRIVYGYLFSLCLDPHTAEDLTSETFLKAIQKINSFDGKVKASTWLCTIGRNLFLNEVRKRSRQTNLEDHILAGPDDPETRFIQKEQLQELLRIVTALEEPKRSVFLMRSQGMRFKDIGAALGKTENWARVTYFRTKEQIIKEMEESK